MTGQEILMNTVFQSVFKVLGVTREQAAAILQEKEAWVKQAIGLFISKLDEIDSRTQQTLALATDICQKQGADNAWLKLHLNTDTDVTLLCDILARMEKNEENNALAFAMVRECHQMLSMMSRNQEQLRGAIMDGTIPCGESTATDDIFMQEVNNA